jgi:hypothetical protein
MSDVVWSFPVIAVIAPNFGLWLVLQNGDKKPKPRSRMTLDELLSLWWLYSYCGWKKSCTSWYKVAPWRGHSHPSNFPHLACPAVAALASDKINRGRSMRLDMAWLSQRLEPTSQFLLHLRDAGSPSGSLAGVSWPIMSHHPGPGYEDSSCLPGL